ncbi:DUF4185 domain-containing protein [Microlunatus soli]|nr:DUF4185 domain-containing protein [Microlunatus soli]
MTDHRSPRPAAAGLSRRGVLTATAIGFAGLAVGTRATPAAAGPDRAVIDAELTRLFGDYGDTAGRWTGADSAYSVPLPDGRIAWLYSDTFLGTVNADHSRPTDSPFIHNSIIIDDHGELTTYTGGTPDAPRSLVAPEGSGDETGSWYWFGDGTVEGDQLRVLVLEFEKTGDGVFDFAFVATAVASFRLPDLAVTVRSLPDSPISWASAVLECGRYSYVYGVEDLQSTKYAHLARVPRGRLTESPWQYYDGAGWSADPTASARILTGVSNEFSVQRLGGVDGGGFGLVTGDARESLSPDILLYRSSTPTGPFTDPVRLYSTPETSGNIFTYNAKSHPELAGDGELLVTYNVNSFDTADVYAEVDNYRPRYLRVLR